MAGAAPGLLLRRALTGPEVQPWVRDAANVDIVAAGKAAESMMTAAHDVLPSGWRRAVVAAPAATQRAFPATDWIVGHHPMPDERSEAAGRAALHLASRQSRDDLLLVLVSGGASSLMVAPAQGLTLEDKRATTATLLRKGATIRELNAVRKHLSALKGGGLAAATAGRALTLAVSDVVGDDLSTIGSGPAVADSTSFASALAVLERWGGVSRYPSPIVRHLEGGARGDIPETPKAFSGERVAARVIASASDALDGATAAAAALGYHVRRLGMPIIGEARSAGRMLIEQWTGALATGTPCCVLSAGETTVRVAGAGRGGRNQELALSIAEALESLGAGDSAHRPHGPVAAASIGTDGIDGPTDAAGAMVDSTTAARARARGLDATQHLADNNAYAFFETLGDLVRTGPTGTNVGDIQIMVAGNSAGGR